MIARVLAGALAAVIAMVGVHVVLVAASAVVAVAIVVLLVMIAGRVAESGWGFGPVGSAS